MRAIANTSLRIGAGQLRRYENIERSYHLSLSIEKEVLMNNVWQL